MILQGCLSVGFCKCQFRKEFLLCLVLFPKGMDLADFCDISFTLAKGRALTTSFPTALVLLSERKQLEQTVKDKIYSGKISGNDSNIETGT